jgi:hypothetical protein
MASSPESRIPATESSAEDKAAAGAALQVLNQAALGYIVSAALNVALELGMADRLAHGPRSSADLAKDAGVSEDGLYRVLRALASAGIFEEGRARTFALNEPGRMLQQGPASLHDLGLWMTDPFHFRVYSEMLHSVRTGQPAVEKITGMPVFEYFARDPKLSAVFNNAMTSWSVPTVAAALAKYDFSGIRVLVDVAGGHGHVLTAVLRQYPAMRGVLFDLDHVIAGAAPLIEASGVRDRVETASGDFFKAVPPGGDAYIMKNIIHDWDDDRAIAILINIRTAFADRRDGRVLLLEAVIPPGNQPDFGKLIDLEMMLMPGGRERTADEFALLFDRAGFELARIVPTESPLSVVEARIAQRS